MSELTEIIDSLDIKIAKLVQKMDNLDKVNQELRNELSKYSGIISRQNQEMAVLKSQYETLKTVNSLLGSDENKRETKLKINSLIREIDYCIAQLSD